MAYYIGIDMAGTQIARKYIAALAALVLLFAGIVLFWRLGSAPFQDYDEATYAEIVSESLAHGDYVSLTFLNQPYFRKPPLMFWMADVARAALPATDDGFAMRLPNALAALGLVALVMLVVWEAGAGWWASLAAGTVLATTSAFMESARSSRFDQLVSFFIVLALYAGMRALRANREALEGNGDERRSAWWYALMGAAVGGAVLSKSVIAVFAPIALLAYFAYTKNLSELLRARFWISIAAFLLVAAPWHIYETIRFGQDFWHSYLGTQVIDRAQQNLFAGTNSPTNAGYLGYFLRFGAPWSELFVLAFIAMPFLLRHTKQGISATYRAAFVATLAVAVVDFVSKTKAVSYLIPLYPFVAIMIALAASAAWQCTSGFERYREQAQGALWGVWKFCGLVAAFLCIYNAWHINPYYGWTANEARDEQAIANAINARTDTPTIYTYKNDDLGSVEYYTRLAFKPSEFVYPLESAASSTAAVPAGSFVLTQDPAALRAAFPQLSFEPLYAGSVLSAFGVAATP